MPIPAPPADASGGYIVIKAAGDGQTHRMRFHVEPFTNDNLGTYNVTTAGREANVQATAADVMKHLAPQFANAVTLSLDAVYRNVGGVISEYFGVTPPATVAGTGGAGQGLKEEYTCWSFRTLNGGHARFFILGAAGWAYGPPVVYAAGNANAFTQMVSYLTGGLPTGDTVTTRVVGHDGSALVGAGTAVSGVNRRIRRRAGDA